MFTGIIQAVGSLLESAAKDGDRRLSIGVGGLPFDAVALGESIAVDGVCLTVVEFDASSFSADVSNETLACTTLGELRAGKAVNLERAMRPDSRFGGHIVAGHVDGTGQIASIHSDARSQRWRISAPGSLLRYIAAKGSICVDGVSLTVNAADDDGFEVNLIPHTMHNTSFHGTRAGDLVNLEVDLMARYAERLLQYREQPSVVRG